MEGHEMAKKRSTIKKTQKAAPAEIKTAVEPAPARNTVFEKVVIAFFIIACLVTAYKVIDYTTGWGDPAKVIKREMADAEKDAIYKRYDSAISIYERIISRWGNEEKLKEETKQAKLNLAKTYKDSERNLDAIELYKKLAAEYQSSNKDMYAWLLLELGDCYNSILSVADAINTYNKVISEFKDTDWAAEALFGIAEAYKSQKDYADAIKYYDLIVTKYKKGFLSAEALTNKGMILEEQEKIKQALAVYKAVVKDFPDIVTEYARQRVDVLSGQTKK
jgi:tetratricopeptide (TPR) repeat protein